LGGRGLKDQRAIPLRDGALRFESDAMEAAPSKWRVDVKRMTEFGETVPQRSECDLRHELSAPVIREI
jgi:hypothetical protein